MSGEVLLDLRRGRKPAEHASQPARTGRVLAGDGIVQCISPAAAAWVPEKFCHAGEAMDRGYSVLIFPEGTRSPDGELHPFRPGIGLLAQQSRVPVVPVALIGLGEMRRGKTRWFRSGQLEVHVGEAVP